MLGRIEGRRRGLQRMRWWDGIIDSIHMSKLKEIMKNPRVSRWKEIIKIRAEINEKETKENIAKIR